MTASDLNTWATRAFLTFLIGAASPLISSGAWSQSSNYPSRPITVIVPFAAGGPADIYARVVSKGLQESLGVPVVVDNRGGATGLIGSRFVKGAAPDGYTLLFTSNSAHIMAPLLYKPASFDPVADFTPIGIAVRYPMYLVTSPKLPAATFKEFIALARSQPGKLNYASNGTGGGAHLGCELMNIAAGVTAVHVPYKGVAPAQMSVITGETDYMCDSVGHSQPMVATKRLKGLALTGAARSGAVPEVPTMSEEGVNVQAYIWLGLLGPTGLPVGIRDKLSTVMASVMNSADMKRRMLNDGYDISAETPEQFATAMNAEKKVWEKVIVEKEIKVE